MALATGSIVVSILLGLAGVARAQVLESTALRLEVTADPFTYRVLEKASGDVLVSQIAVTFTVDPPAPPAPDGGAPDALGDGGVDATDVDAATDAVPDVSPDAPVDAPLPLSLTVTRASNVATTATTLEAQLEFGRADERGRMVFTFQSPQVLEVKITREGQPARSVLVELTDRQERYYGVWEFPFDGRLDSGGSNREYLGVGRNAGANYVSGRAPFYLTSRHYGVYVRSSAYGRFRLGVGGQQAFSFNEPGLTYDIVYGPSYYDQLARYTALAGAPFLPPLWALGATWWADDFHRDLRGSANAQEHALDVATQLQTLRIPASALMVDRPYGTGLQGWGNMDFDASFPDPPRLVSDLQARGLELVLWIANRAWNNLYTEGTEQGFLFPGSMTLGPAADLRNPAAYAWWRDKLSVFLALGAKGYKIDRGEENEMPASAQNENVTLYARLAREGLEARHGAEAFLFARNVTDTGRRFTAVWNGDTSANFAGLTSSVAAALRSGMIAMPMWGSDTGGYTRNATSPNDEVFARWFGFSAWSPMMEVLVGDGHTPWYHHAAIVDIARAHSVTHFDLIPYTRSFLQAATRTGAPVMRALVLSYPDDPEVFTRADEYLYGTELLVAPLLTAGATTRAVYLPAGRWLDYNGRRAVFAGSQTVTAEAPLAVIPVFVREGAIVPRGRLLRGNDNWTASWSPALRVELFPAETSLSRTFDYFTGAAVEPITAATEAKKLTVTFGNLAVPGQLDIHVKTAGAVTRNGTRLSPPDYTFDPTTRLLTIPFTGPSTVVVEDITSVFTPDPPPDAAPAPAPDASLASASDGGCSCTTAPRSSSPQIWLLLIALAWRRIRRR